MVLFRELGVDGLLGDLQLLVTAVGDDARFEERLKPRQIGVRLLQSPLMRASPVPRFARWRKRVSIF